MANTYHQIYLQFIFAVKYRKALIDTTWKPRIQSVIGNLFNENNCKTLIVNGVHDHMHCLIQLNPAISISELMKSVKSKSSKYINDNKLTIDRFSWQKGYAAFSYNRNDIDVVYNYISNQEEHHKKFNFKEEYLKLLDENKIEYDHRYLFQELK